MPAFKSIQIGMCAVLVAGVAAATDGTFYKGYEMPPYSVQVSKVPSKSANMTAMFWPRSRSTAAAHGPSGAGFRCWPITFLVEMQTGRKST